MDDLAEACNVLHEAPAAVGERVGLLWANTDRVAVDKLEHVIAELAIGAANTALIAAEDGLEAVHEEHVDDSGLHCRYDLCYRK